MLYPYSWLANPSRHSPVPNVWDFSRFEKIPGRIMLLQHLVISLRCLNIPWTIALQYVMRCTRVCFISPKNLLVPLLSCFWVDNAPKENLSFSKGKIQKRSKLLLNLNKDWEPVVGKIFLMTHVPLRAKLFPDIRKLAFKLKVGCSKRVTAQAFQGITRVRRGGRLGYTTPNIKTLFPVFHGGHTHILPNTLNLSKLSELPPGKEIRRR